MTCLLLIVTFLSAGGGSSQSADSEAQQRIIIRPADPPSDSKRGPILAWHSRYLESTAGLRLAWAVAKRDIRDWSPRSRRSGCRLLLRYSAEPRDDLVETAPDFRLRLYLGRWLGHLDRGARACLSGRYFDAAFLFDQADRARAELAETLRPFGLEP